MDVSEIDALRGIQHVSVRVSRVLTHCRLCVTVARYVVAKPSDVNVGHKASTCAHHRRSRCGRVTGSSYWRLRGQFGERESKRAQFRWLAEYAVDARRHIVFCKQAVSPAGQ